jgi:hypothetical protein
VDCHNCVTAKMQMAKLYFYNFLASEHLILIIVVPIPHSSPLILGVGSSVLKIKCFEAKKWQKQSLAICIFAVTPFISFVFLATFHLSHKYRSELQLLSFIQVTFLFLDRLAVDSFVLCVCLRIIILKCRPETIYGWEENVSSMFPRNPCLP